MYSSYASESWGHILFVLITHIGLTYTKFPELFWGLGVMSDPNATSLMTKTDNIQPPAPSWSSTILIHQAFALNHL